MGREYSQEFHTATIGTTVKGSYPGVSLLEHATWQTRYAKAMFRANMERADDLMTHGAGFETVWTRFGWPQNGPSATGQGCAYGMGRIDV